MAVRWMAVSGATALRGLLRHGLRPSFVLLTGLLIGVVAVLVAALITGWEQTLAPEQAWLSGAETLTGGRFTLNRVDTAVLGVLTLVLIRWARLDWLALRPGPVEVRPLEDAGELPVDERQLHRFSVQLREALTSCQIYQTTSVPGDPETEQIIEVFREAQGAQRLALLGAIWTFLWPTRAFVVSAVLRSRPEPPRHAVTVSVRRLPGPGTELETRWTNDVDTALRTAAYAVTAHILPRTRARERPPWRQWRERSRGIWPTRPLPTELMMHYQQAKHLVSERRYDEALSEYHRALLYDTDNVILRYDVGQIFERLRLYPDAVRIYAELTEHMFPLRERSDGSQGRKLSEFSLPWLHDDPLMVRYRYVAALIAGSQLAAELIVPDWAALRDWMDSEHRERTLPADQRRWDRHLRPWRAAELGELRVRLSADFDRAWLVALPPEAALAGCGLRSVLVDDPLLDEPPTFLARAELDSQWRDLEPRTARVRAVEEYFLHVARFEIDSLLKDFRQYSGAWGRRGPRTGLTLSALKLMQLLIDYRGRRFRPAGSFPGGDRGPWRPQVRQMDADLQDHGYDPKSRHWLEHYVAACLRALPLQEDRQPVAEHQEFAEAAVRSLDRAQECGDETDFVIAKRYWLLAGDPDLAGLRRYDCFRAFEGRVYLHPQPTAIDPAKYELFHYMRLGLLRGSTTMEEIWWERAGQSADQVPARTLEHWFRWERRAWEILVRVGRFNRQWQTRSAALDALRALHQETGRPASPVHYPEVIDDYINVGSGTPDHAQDRIKGMERIFRFLAHDLGPAARLDPDGPDQRDGVLSNTRAWIWQAEYAARLVPGADHLLSPPDYEHLCRARAAVWSALRQWVTTPARREEQALVEAVARLPFPPTPPDGPGGAAGRRPSG